MNEDRKKIEMINQFCLDQMEISDKFNSDYHEGIGLVCSKIHGFIIRTTKDEMKNLSLLKTN